MRITPCPPVGELTFPEIPEFQSSVLPSGAELHVLRRESADLCMLTIVMPGGAPEAGSPPLSALRSILLREGTAAYSGERIAYMLDYNGAWLKQSDNSHFTVVTVYCLSSRLDVILPLLRDIVFNPTFPEPAFLTRREALAKSIEISHKDVDFRSKCLSDALIMGSTHPMAVTDTAETIRAISREEIVDFHNRITSPSHIRIILAGGVTPEVIAKVADTFSRTSDAPSGSGDLNIVPFSPALAGTYRSVTLPGATQSAVNIVLPAVPRSHPHYLPLRLAVNALGGYFGSRLMTNIREEKGLTYGIGASLLGMLDGAYIQISADTDNSSVGALVEEVRHEMASLAQNPPQGEELVRFRRAMGSNLAALLETPYSVADYLASMLIGGMKPGYFRRQVDILRDLTPDDIADMARKYLRPELLSTAVAGDNLPASV